MEILFIIGPGIIVMMILMTIHGLFIRYYYNFHFPLKDGQSKMSTKKLRLLLKERENLNGNLRKHLKFFLVIHDMAFGLVLLISCLFLFAVLMHIL